MDTIKMFGGFVAVLLLAWLIIAGPIGSIIGLGDEAERLIGSKIRHCPDGVKIDGYPEKMAMYLDEDQGFVEPAYAIDIFEEYLSCAQKGVFTQQEMSEYESEIINCAEAAYVLYIEFLDAKVKELDAMAGSASQSAPKDYTDYSPPVSDEYEDEYAYDTQSADEDYTAPPPPPPLSSPAADVKADLDYHKDLLKEYTKKHKIFKALYKALEPQKICKYEATGKAPEREPAGPDKLCGPNQPCMSGLKCISVGLQSFCSSGEVGGFCSSESDCETGLKCVDSHVPSCSDGLLGAPCGDDSDCSEGICNKDICIEKVADGELCSDTVECSSDSSCIGLQDCGPSYVILKPDVCDNNACQSWDIAAGKLYGDKTGVCLPVKQDNRVHWVKESMKAKGVWPASKDKICEGAEDAGFTMPEKDGDWCSEASVCRQGSTCVAIKDCDTPVKLSDCKGHCKAWTAATEAVDGADWGICFADDQVSMAMEDSMFVKGMMQGHPQYPGWPAKNNVRCPGYS